MATNDVADLTWDPKGIGWYSAFQEAFLAAAGDACVVSVPLAQRKSVNDDFDFGASNGAADFDSLGRPVKGPVEDATLVVLVAAADVVADVR